MNSQEITSRVNFYSNIYFRAMVHTEALRYMDLESVDMSARCVTAAHS